MLALRSDCGFAASRFRVCRSRTGSLMRPMSSIAIAIGMARRRAPGRLQESMVLGEHFCYRIVRRHGRSGQREDQEPSLEGGLVIRLTVGGACRCHRPAGAGGNTNSRPVFSEGHASRKHHCEHEYDAAARKRVRRNRSSLRPGLRWWSPGSSGVGSSGKYRLSMSTEHPGFMSLRRLS